MTSTDLTELLHDLYLAFYLILPPFSWPAQRVQTYSSVDPASVSSLFSRATIQNACQQHFWNNTMLTLIRCYYGICPRACQNLVKSSFAGHTPVPAMMQTLWGHPGMSEVWDLVIAQISCRHQLGHPGLFPSQPGGVCSLLTHCEFGHNHAGSREWRRCPQRGLEGECL